MVGLLTLTGGASLAGVWVYRRLEKGTRPAAAASWWKASWQTVQETLHTVRQGLMQRSPRPLAAALATPPPALTLLDIAEPTAAIRYGLWTSALALGVTTTGRLLFPPLQVAGLPLLVYMGLPPAQTAYTQLQLDGRPGSALAETMLLVVCLAGGYYWVGALGFCLYYGGRTLLAKKPQDGAAQGSLWDLPATTHRWQAGAACAVPVATLQPGDHLLLQSGEMTPVDGQIVEGVAWVQAQALSATACGLRKGVGSRVTATDIVVVGRICVQVLSPAAG